MKSISYLHMTQTILTIKILVVVLSYVQLFVNPWTVACQALLSVLKHTKRKEREKERAYLAFLCFDLLLYKRRPTLVATSMGCLED